MNERGFNSMKVRLKHADPKKRAYRDMKFQFHEGPIKTVNFILLNNVNSCFNSMKVRLKPRAFLYENSFECVSIP